ncbi:SWIM zinc finger family protein [Sinorhizobium sp. RAC02]|uniref:SWIM zinc finger family protein n=1 Tax=Sinorhizobium sp. RAC02 TaxID=1842534 RepID=UPI00083D36C8|nr:SWIM zinc finger family protein [Sinorhizobium sp. RAC02]AOF92286.1 SWIM zinc finger family protein [Sinorhizobium sp. RAC02]
MARSDLLALTDDGLTQLSNAGIVKRAQRELAAGAGPEIRELEDGTIEARFADATFTRLPPGKELAEASCTCPSSGVCRHRILLAITYRAAGTGSTDAVSEETKSWTPASLDLDSFETALGTSAKAELTRLLSARHTVRLDYGQVPAARLPMASVRFLVPNDLGYARCDCAQGRGCVHTALAIRAFRAADGASDVTIGGNGGMTETVDKASLTAACVDLLRHLLDAGVTAGMSAHAQPLERSRRQAELLGASQALLVIEALTEQIEAYEARSARHDEHAAFRLAVELIARTRASDAAMALGMGEPFETAMAKSRLVSLGARLRQEGQDIRASVLLADSDTGATMLMEKLFSPLPNETEFHASVLRRQFGQGLPVQAVGRGQILTSVARRRADGLLALGSGAGGKTQVMPRDGNFSFPPPVAARRVETIAGDFTERPISLVRPRKRVDDVHVFKIEAVLGQTWSAGTQSWEGAVELTDDGGTLYLEREFDSGAPAATATLAAALDGRWGAIHRVAGPVRMQGGFLICEPWSLSADRFIVPDLDSLDKAAATATPPSVSRLSDILDETERLLSGAIHAGGRARSSREAIGKPLKRRIETAGFLSLAARLDVWFDADIAIEPNAFYDVAIWLLALRELGETKIVSHRVV